MNLRKFYKGKKYKLLDLQTKKIHGTHLASMGEAEDQEAAAEVTVVPTAALCGQSLSIMASINTNWKKKVKWHRNQEQKNLLSFCYSSSLSIFCPM